MPESREYKCSQCGQLERDALQGVRALRPCTECNEVTSWDRVSA